MLIKSTLNTKHSQAGVTLIELMISIVLGLLILAAATAMTVKSMVINADSLGSARLNQDLDSVIQVMVNDIRRAGYTGGVFFFADDEDLNIVSSSCVLYAYDANENGSLDNNEKYGFRQVGTAIEMRTTCAAGATCATACNTGTWVPLTDSDTINITNLSFDSVNSKCISITHPDNITASNLNNFWITTAADTLEFPCMESDGTTNLNTYVMDTDDVYQPAGTFVEAAPGDRLIEARQVNVEIQAQLTNDATMRKRQVVAITARNDHIYTIPIP